MAQIASQEQKDELRRQFNREVQILSFVSHPNIVRLYGASIGQGTQLALVFENLPLGSLHGILFNSQISLTIDQRLSIAIDAAMGISYLHGLRDDNNPAPITNQVTAERLCVLHRDIKSANIALNENFTAKLIDVGLAKIVQGPISTRTHSKGRGSGREREISSFSIFSDCSTSLIVFVAGWLGLWTSQPPDR
jgi:serine/threonine protein kinase